MQKIKVVLADSDEEFRRTLKDALGGTGKIEVIGETGDREGLRRLMREVAPDVIVMDYLLNGQDGLEVLERLREQAERPKILVVSQYMSGFMAGDTLFGRADNSLNRSCGMDMILHKIYCLARDRRAALQPHMNQERISQGMEEAFRALRIPSQLKGFLYLQEAVSIAVQDTDMANAVTKELYPETAKRCRSTPIKVERGIRHVIELFWDRDDETVKRKFFGPAAADMGKPTNSVFISKLADWIRRAGTE